MPDIPYVGPEHMCYLFRLILRPSSTMSIKNLKKEDVRTKQKYKRTLA